MEFNGELFGDQMVKRPDVPKVVGQTLTSADDVVIPDGLKRLLKKKNIEGEILKFPDTINYKLFKKEKYQIKVEDTYYAVQYNIYPLWDSITILLTSKNPFI